MKIYLILFFTLCSIFNNTFADDKIESDKKKVLNEIQMTEKFDRFHLEHIPESLKKDRDIVLAAITKNPENLEFADKVFKNDLEIVLVAIKAKKNENSFFSDNKPDVNTVLEHIGDELKNNDTSLLRLMDEEPIAIKYSGNNLRSDKEFILKAIKKTPITLGFAAKELLADKEFILAVVKLDGLSLEYADSSLKKDKDVVLAALNSNPSALRFADFSLKTDMDFRKAQKEQTLAVVPVIFYHAGFNWVSGGYVGVDIFFVISGYLITTIILKEKSADTFSLLNFYERRARRILPALFFVLLVCVPFAWFWLLPHELNDFGKSIIAVAVFASNILFWKESDYFSADSELIPLLHTWSLAVEEQFYVFFPIILMLFWSLGKRRLLGIIILIALLSFGMTEWAWRNIPSANFYLIPTRAWELMIGALVAFYLYQTNQPRGVVHIVEKGVDKKSPFSVSQFASLAGIGLIAYSVFILDKTIPFPSMYALAPTMGAALVILFATPGTLVYKLLSFRGLVGIGLISYSAYLWHQPLFVFARIYTMDELQNWLVGLLIFTTFGLAYLSWRFVEKPFRNRSRFSRKQIFSAAIAGSLIFIGLGLVSGYLERKDKVLCAKSDHLSQAKEQIAKADIVILVARWRDWSAKALPQTIKNLKLSPEKKLFVVGRKSFGKIRVRKYLRMSEEKLGALRNPVESQHNTINNLMKDTLSSEIFINLHNLVCGSSSDCPVFTNDKKLISFDGGHLTKDGARYIGDILFKNSKLAEL
ncbi:putative peptidoglycan O-acetyltransferase YrhL [Nymphon striatum]|nr:putative peptidoglycan O-acetyltransferase YrhL [Nymphon striatum]